MDRDVLTVKKSEALFKLLTVYKTQKKLRIGINEAIKAVKSGLATLVVLADDSTPQCLTESIAILCEQQGVRSVYVNSKEELGKACKLDIHSIAVAIIEERDVDNSKMAKELSAI